MKEIKELLEKLEKEMEKTSSEILEELLGETKKKFDREREEIIKETTEMLKETDYALIVANENGVKFVGPLANLMATYSMITEHLVNKLGVDERIIRTMVDKAIEKGKEEEGKDIEQLLKDKLEELKKKIEEM